MRGPALEIVNGSTESITYVRAEITTRPRDLDQRPDRTRKVAWQWGNNVTPRLDYLLPGQSDHLAGSPVRDG
jgi:hypothetical protein